jgi:hypothetical protein
MTLAILLGAAIVLGAGYTFLVAVPQYIRVPGHRAPGQESVANKYAAWRS